jgi:hypothetical protein
VAWIEVKQCAKIPFENIVSRELHKQKNDSILFLSIVFQQGAQKLPCAHLWSIHSNNDESRILERG